MVSPRFTLIFPEVHLSDLSLQADRDPPRLGGEDEAGAGGCAGGGCGEGGLTPRPRVQGCVRWEGRSQQQLEQKSTQLGPVWPGWLALILLHFCQASLQGLATALDSDLFSFSRLWL